MSVFRGSPFACSARRVADDIGLVKTKKTSYSYLTSLVNIYVHVMRRLGFVFFCSWGQCLLGRRSCGQAEPNCYSAKTRSIT